MANNFKTSILLTTSSTLKTNDIMENQYSSIIDLNYHCCYTKSNDVIKFEQSQFEKLQTPVSGLNTDNQPTTLVKINELQKTDPLLGFIKGPEESYNYKIILGPSSEGFIVSYANTGYDFYQFYNTSYNVPNNAIFPNKLNNDNKLYTYRIFSPKFNIVKYGDKIVEGRLIKEYSWQLTQETEIEIKYAVTIGSNPNYSGRNYLRINVYPSLINDSNIDWYPNGLIAFLRYINLELHVTVAYKPLNSSNRFSKAFDFYFSNTTNTEGSTYVYFTDIQANSIVEVPIGGSTTIPTNGIYTYGGIEYKYTIKTTINN